MNCDIVIILGKGSRWNDNELKYSLRSIEKHLTNYENIYLIGEKPAWTQNVIHLPHPDLSKISDVNQYHKTLRACIDPTITANLLYFHDDHFLLSDFEANNFPNFHKGPLIEVKRYDPYGKRVKNTEQYLKHKGYPTLNFDVHTPILFNKSAWLESVHKANWKEESYVIKSLYANQQEINYIRIDDCKIYRTKDIEGKQIISTYPNPSFEIKQFLKERFPNKSRYEL